jgi:hypothetical protein
MLYKPDILALQIKNESINVESVANFLHSAPPDRQKVFVVEIGLRTQSDDITYMTQLVELIMEVRKITVQQIEYCILTDLMNNVI